MSVDINKLNWRDARHIKIDHVDWNQLVDELLDHGFVEAPQPLKTTKRNFSLGSFKFDDDKRDKDLYAVDFDGELLHYYTANDNDKNSDEHVGGMEAYRDIAMKFSNLNSISFAKAFGTWIREEKDTAAPNEYHYALEQCNSALTAIIDCDDLCKNIILSNVYKADVSSAYPYQLTKALPTTEGMIGPIEGAIEPPNGYVAYWIKSGHVIAEDVDTRYLSQHPAYEHRHKFKEVPLEQEITYLLPYSRYTLKPIMEELYSGRRANPKNKGVMNSFIGILRSRKEWQHAYMGHISALVYARHITYMCQLYDCLIADGCYPIMYATDSIMWLGGPCGIAERNKYLGSFTLEYENCRAIYTSCGNYALEDPQTKALALIKHQGISEEMWKSRNIRTLEDFRTATVVHWSERYNKKTHKFELYEKMEV